ncbi:MAG TPA: hypothetical protein VH372_25430 [Actinospica sp.]|jgi:hypothetical protein|nr:hypothetical protein [Actinospica sp.]
MVRSTSTPGRSERVACGGARRQIRLRRYGHRPLAPLDLRTPSGRTELPY